MEDYIFKFTKKEEIKDEDKNEYGMEAIKYIGEWENISEFVEFKVGKEKYKIGKTVEGKINIAPQEILFVCLRALNNKKVNELLDLFEYGDLEKLIPTCKKIK